MGWLTSKHYNDVVIKNKALQLHGALIGFAARGERITRTFGKLMNCWIAKLSSKDRCFESATDILGEACGESFLVFIWFPQDQIVLGAEAGKVIAQIWTDIECGAPVCTDLSMARNPILEIACLLYH